MSSLLCMATVWVISLYERHRSKRRTLVLYAVMNWAMKFDAAVKTQACTVEFTRTEGILVGCSL